MTHYLKFPDEATAQVVLAEYYKDGQWQQASHAHALDVVGTIYKPTGEKIETEIGLFDAMGPIDGFHINFIGELPETAADYVVTPAAPVRVFA